MDIEHKEEDLVLLFDELPSFVEEEEEDSVVPSLEEKVVAFEPLKEDEYLLQEKEEKYI